VGHHFSRSRLARATGHARARLTFSNLTAVLALFVALGGSSYAAIRVGSAEIANNSIRSKDIHDGEVRGPDIKKDTIRGTDVRDSDIQGRDLRDHTISGDDIKESSLDKVPLAGDADTVGGKSAAAFLGSDELVRVGPVALQTGDERTVASSGPFTWTAHCTDEGGGSTRLVVKLESTEADSFGGNFGQGGGDASPGSPAVMFDSSGTTPNYGIAFPLSATAPSGQAPVGIAFAGIHTGGADCLVNGMMLP
jgi:hypothetical protein